MSTGFYKSIKKMEVNNEGKTTFIKGSGKASDFKKQPENKKPIVEEFWDDDTIFELGIRRMN
jgi:hypothetical protein